MSSLSTSNFNFEMRFSEHLYILSSLVLFTNSQTPFCGSLGLDRGADSLRRVRPNDHLSAPKSFNLLSHQPHTSHKTSTTDKATHTSSNHGYVRAFSKSFFQCPIISSSSTTSTKSLPDISSDPLPTVTTEDASHESEMRPTQTFHRFLNLPPELRATVYGLYFKLVVRIWTVDEDLGLHTVHYHALVNGEDEGSVQGDRTTSLLRACKLIFLESAPILFHKLRFIIIRYDAMCSPFLFLAWLSKNTRVGSRTARLSFFKIADHVRHIELLLLKNSSDRPGPLCHLQAPVKYERLLKMLDAVKSWSVEKIPTSEELKTLDSFKRDSRVRFHLSGTTSYLTSSVSVYF